MSAMTKIPKFIAIRGSVLHFPGDPEHAQDEDAFEFFEDNQPCQLALPDECRVT